MDTLHTHTTAALYEAFNPSEAKRIAYTLQSLRQLRKAEGGLSGMDTAQAGDPVENLGQ